MRWLVGLLVIAVTGLKVVQAMIDKIQDHNKQTKQKEANGYTGY